MIATPRPDWRETSVRRVLRQLDRPARSGLGVITAYRDGAVTLRSNRREDGYTFSDTENGYQEIRPGDLVFHALDGFAGAVGVSDSHGNGSPVYHVCEPVAGDHPAYLARLLRHLGTSGFLTTQAPNVRERSVDFRNWSTFARIPLVLPPADEQRSIADYLDRETARIDTLIEEQQRLIDMLHERRQDLIRDTVLGVTNPFSPPSDVAFTAIGYHFSVTLGKMLDGSKEARAGDLMLPYIRAGNIQDSGLRLSDVNQMPYSAREAASLNLLKGDLLVVEGGAVGTNALVRQDMPGWSFQKTVNRLRPLNNWSSSWLGYVLRTYRDVGVIDIVCNKSTIPHLTAEKLRSMRIPMVQPLEQWRVATMLDQETAKIDRLIAESDRFIELSRERRSALITAAVTGQIDLREVA
ncbi:restriction endonuclease subunit S [Streptomyces sp. NRRL S-378]|uniref:restriction endonuclease subunit S n=1 Tax=Streptomyces sp. NRRL S-378 TaxID=1463904 RepID=UPI00131D4E5C|nr:restriction endonuclease subunit S [Streptomyces sp. NRRL S-378]